MEFRAHPPEWSFAILLIFGLSTGCDYGKKAIAGENSSQQEVSESTDKRIVTTLEKWPEDYTPEKNERLRLTESEWKKRLTEREFYILRESGTEPAGSGDLLDNNEEGIYRCAACGAPLYHSKTKFSSGTGWPSFYKAIPDRVGRKPDNKLGMQRTELYCKTCKSHLGHVFQDGPDPTGERHCINSIALDFKPEEENTEGSDEDSENTQNGKKN